VLLKNSHNIKNIQMLHTTLRPTFDPAVILATDRILVNPRAREFIYQHIDEFDFDDEAYTFLSRNPSMVDLFKWQPREIKWDDMCENPKAKDLILDNVDRWIGTERVKRLRSMARNSDPDVLQYVIEAAETGNPFVMQYVWSTLSFNEHAFHLIDWVRHFDRIDWRMMSFNEAAIPLLEAHQDRINWETLSFNKNAIHLIEANLLRIEWENLCQNESAIHLLEANQNRINWTYLSSNPAAMPLIEANLDKVDWSQLSRNTAAIHLIEANFDKVNWHLVAANPAIFEETYDYVRMKKARAKLIKTEELIEKVFHPNRVVRHFEKYSYNIGEDDYESDNEPSRKRTKN